MDPASSLFTDFAKFVPGCLSAWPPLAPVPASGFCTGLKTPGKYHFLSYLPTLKNWICPAFVLPLSSLVKVSSWICTHFFSLPHFLSLKSLQPTGASPCEHHTIPHLNTPSTTTASCLVMLLRARFSILAALEASLGRFKTYSCPGPPQVIWLKCGGREYWPWWFLKTPWRMQPVLITTSLEGTILCAVGMRAFVEGVAENFENGWEET